MQSSQKTNGNWLDSAINFVSPTLGLRRQRARAMQDIMLRYEGVRSERRQGGWMTSGASGNAEIGTGLRKLRDNARDLCRNNAYARKAKREWAKRVVGTGITPRPASDNDGINRILKALWDEFATNCSADQRLNFYALEKMIVQSTFETGEVLVRLWDRLSDDGLTIPFQVQLLEADYLDTDKIQSEGRRIIHGVEMDGRGKVLGYWILGGHPGDSTFFSRGMESKFVPARFILHHAEFDRPGDVRAVTRLAAVMAKLRDLDEYADAELVRKKIAACLTGMITQSEGSDGPSMSNVAVDAEGRRIEEFRPGQFIYGAPGTSMELFSPPDSGDFTSHKKAELREIATGVEIPYVVLNDDLEAVNYSSYRGGLLAFRDAIEEYRYNWLIPQVLDPIWNKFVVTAFALGHIPMASCPVEWDPPQFDLLDRAAEAEADRAELQIGSSTWPQVVSRRGYDPTAQLAEISKYRAPLESAGVTFAKSTTDSASAQQSQAQEPTQ